MGGYYDNRRGCFRERIRNQGRLAVPGQAASLAIAITAIILFTLSFKRADPAPELNGLRLETWVALGVSVLAGLVFAVKTMRGNQELAGKGKTD